MLKTDAKKTLKDLGVPELWNESTQKVRIPLRSLVNIWKEVPDDYLSDWPFDNDFKYETNK